MIDNMDVSIVRLDILRGNLCVQIDKSRRLSLLFLFLVPCSLFLVPCSLCLSFARVYGIYPSGSLQSC